MNNNPFYFGAPCACGHENWQHFQGYGWDDGDPRSSFRECEHKGCPCGGFRLPTPDEREGRLTTSLGA